MNIETTYRPPSTKDLITDGYYMRYVSYEATDKIIAHLKSYGNPFSPYTQIYLLTHSNSIVHPCRMAVSIMAYGIHHPEQFGNKYDNVLYQSAVRFIRHMLAHIEARHKGRSLQFRKKHFIALANLFYEVLYKDALILCNRVRPKVHIVKEEDKWWLIKKRVVEQVVEDDIYNM